MPNNEHVSIKASGQKLFNLLKLEKQEVIYIYFFASLAGIIQLSLPLGIQAIIGLLYGGIVSASLVLLICFVVGGVILAGVFQIMQMRVSEHIQQRIFARLTFAYAYRIPKIDLLSVDRYYLPELVNRFFDTSTLQKGIAKLLLDIPAASIQILFGLILLSFYHPVFIAFGLVLLIVVGLIFSLTSPKGLRTSIEESDYKYKAAHWLEELSRAIKTFKFSQATGFHLQQTDKLTEGYLEARNAHFKVLVFQYRILIGFKAIITTAMLVIGSLLLIRQQINLGQFVAAEIIIIVMLNSVEKLIVSLETVYDMLASVEKLDKVLQKPQDPVTEHQLNISAEQWKRAFSISVDNLSFAYPGGNRVINGTSFNVGCGEKVCIKGAEGTGKTTLLRILAGLYHSYSGSITVNNVPLQNIPATLWHDRVAIYFAREELFSGTLWDNLTIGKTGFSTDEVGEICELVGLTSFIKRSKDGYVTMLDPVGQTLSDSMIQKILLARCLLAKPSLILLESGWQHIEKQYQETIVKKLVSDKSFTLISISDDGLLESCCDRVMNITLKN